MSILFLARVSWGEPMTKNLVKERTPFLSLTCRGIPLYVWYHASFPPSSKAKDRLDRWGADGDFKARLRLTPVLSTQLIRVAY